MSGIAVTINRRRLDLSNLQKIIYPATGFTKGQVIDYYQRIAPVLLPHLKDRALTLKRYPNGVNEKFFYEKRCPGHRPDWVKTAPIYSKDNDDTIDYCVINDVASLAWIANLASLELHTSLAKVKDVTRPTMMAFDLDPGLSADMLDCIAIGQRLRELLHDVKLECFAKTSGGKGLHVYVPLNTPTSFSQTKEFANAVARILEKDDPKRVTSNMKKNLREGKVFIDWSQNDQHKTTVSVYSLRAREKPTVSTPVSWDELENAHKKNDAKRLVFEADAVLKRVEKDGDLFAEILRSKQKLVAAT